MSDRVLYGFVLSVRARSLQQRVNQEIIAISERFINESSHRLAREQMQFAECELESASVLIDARNELLAFQRSTACSIPLRRLPRIPGVTVELQAALARQEAELKSMLNYLNEDAPPVRGLNAQIEGTRAQLEVESRARNVERRRHEPECLAGDYQELFAEVEFAQDSYKLALTAVETARVESNRKLKSLVLVASPALPESPRVSAANLHVHRPLGGSRNAVRNRAAGGRHDRGSSTMSGRAVRALASLCIALCALAPESPARAQLNPLDVETVRSAAQARGLTDGNSASVEAAAPSAAPSPPPAADAAALLGSDEAANEPPMFGQQLFRGALQSYGVGFNPEYMLAIGDRVQLRIWGSFTLRSRADDRRARQRVRPERRARAARRRA